MTDEKPGWLDRARRLREYRREALEFIERVQSQFPVSRDHARAVSLLWYEADQRDDTVCSLLAEVNSGLLESSGEMDITRGASLRAIGFGMGLPPEQAVFYECAWSLAWGSDRGISVVLAIDPRNSAFDAHVRALKTRESHRVPYPFTDADLKEPLTLAYLSESAADDTRLDE
ncbi:MAG: hypothetical protein L0177_04265 [Chloroflexi bacterium]|nr:hypothetical protein [Chloroflexota bacterium]